MKVHCPKCNSVNFLPSTLPSSIISNISCAVCKELIDVPNQPELELPDEDLMDVSSLRDKLDEKGRFLNPQANKETAETISLASYDLPPLPSDEADPLQFDDLPMPASDESYPMIPDETVSLAPLELNETVDLSYQDLHWEADNLPNQPERTADFSETYQNQFFKETPQPYQPQTAQEHPYASDVQETFESNDFQPQPEEPVFQTVIPPTPAAANENFQETSNGTQQSDDEDIWAHLRRETQQAQAQTSPAPLPQQDVGPLLITDEPRKSSNTGIKVLLFGVLALLFLGVGAGAVWLYMNQESNETAKTTQPVTPKTNPNTATTNTGKPAASTNVNTATTSATSGDNTNATTNTNNKNQTASTETKNTSAQTNQANTSAPQNNNTKDASTETHSTSTRERVVKTENAGGNSSNGSITIQVGSYPNAEGANSRVAQLQSMGFPARVVVANIPKRGTWYRVHVGRFASREEADRYVRELKSKGATKDALVTDVQ